MANEIVDYIKANTGQILAGTGILATGAVVGGAVGYAIGKRKTKKKAKKKKKKRTSKLRNSKYSSKRRRKSSGSYARTAGKRRDRSTKRIRMTKTGQPYVILANGRARFIKKSSAKASRKRKGGRY